VPPSAGFLAKAVGVPVTRGHPTAAEESAIVGVVTTVFVQHGEVWGIAQISDAAAATALNERSIEIEGLVIFARAGDEEAASLDHVALIEA
jgi:hypothetical protein